MAMGMPMTKAIEEVFSYLPKIVDKKMVCGGVGIRPSAKNVFSNQSREGSV